MSRIMQSSWMEERLRPVGRVIAATVCGFLATALVLVLFYRAGGLEEVMPPVVLAGEALQLARGEGGQTSAGLEIRKSGAQELSSVQGSARMVRASIYHRVSWQVDGLESAHQVRLIWSTLAEPDTVREVLLPLVGAASGTFDLATQPAWRGRIAVVGLVVQGALARPLVVRRLELVPKVLGVAELARMALTEWTAFEDWSQRSINFTAGAPLDALFPPVLIVALWVGFGMVFLALFGQTPRALGAWKSYAALFLLGWLVLDVRWQWDLSQRLVKTETLFAGKTGDERTLAGAEGEFYQFLLEVRRRLPREPVRRLFIVSTTPGGYWAGRARYHLLPHNGYMGFLQPPAVGTARPGDYVLILSPLPGVRYDRERRLLMWAGGGQLPAERLYAAELGAVLRVLGE